MTIEERRKILAARLRGARLKANAQRKLSQANQRQFHAKGGNRYQPLTQAFVARQLGISQSFLSKLEKGLQEPNFLLVELLSRYYGVRLSVFETYTSEEKRLGHHLNAH
jgi:transcriptional regulator with XRE-family HTH domain